MREPLTHFIFVPTLFVLLGPFRQNEKKIRKKNLFLTLHKTHYM